VRYSMAESRLAFQMARRNLSSFIIMFMVLAVQLPTASSATTGVTC
jgi:hypothetical protein